MSYVLEELAGWREVLGANRDMLLGMATKAGLEYRLLTCDRSVLGASSVPNNGRIRHSNI